MRLVTREFPDAWYDNEAIVFEGEDPEPFAVEVTTATHANLMFAPHGPDEVHSFSAQLLALPDCLVVKVAQFSFILEPVTKCRYLRSADRGRTWSPIEDAEMSALTEGREPQLISETT
jgi:hypothetical protein